MKSSFTASARAPRWPAWLLPALALLLAAWTVHGAVERFAVWPCGDDPARVHTGHTPSLRAANWLRAPLDTLRPHQLNQAMAHPHTRKWLFRKILEEEAAPAWSEAERQTAMEALQRYRTQPKDLDLLIALARAGQLPESEAWQHNHLRTWLFMTHLGGVLELLRGMPVYDPSVRLHVDRDMDVIIAAFEADPWFQAYLAPGLRWGRPSH